VPAEGPFTKNYDQRPELNCVTVRIPREVWEAIKGDKLDGRSATAEVVSRLRRSLEPEPAPVEAQANGKTKR
jgi:hypothetical protein